MEAFNDEGGGGVAPPRGDFFLCEVKCYVAHYFEEEEDD
jgi:hypothetical protein